MPSPIRLIRSEQLPATPYAHAAAVSQDAQQLLFSAGACPLDADGNLVAPGDLRGQAECAIDNLVAVLEAAGSSLADVVKTTIYVASHERADLVTVWNVVANAFVGHEVPSTPLGVAVLGYPGQLVEIEVIAVAQGDARARGDVGLKP